MGISTAICISIFFICVTFFNGGAAFSFKDEPFYAALNSLSEKLNGTMISPANSANYILDQPAYDGITIKDTQRYDLNVSYHCISWIEVQTTYLDVLNNYNLTVRWDEKASISTLQIDWYSKGIVVQKCESKGRNKWSLKEHINDYHVKSFSFHEPDKMNRYVEIEPSCNYTITIEPDGPYCEPLQLRYSVPRCLPGMPENKCMKCEHEGLIPAPNITVRTDTTGVFVDWEIPDMKPEILNNTRQIVIIIDPLQLSSEQPQDRVINLTLPLDLFDQKTISGSQFFELNNTNHLKRSVTAQFVDEQDCKGNKAYKEFIFPVSSSPKLPWVWIVTVFVLLVVLVFSIVYMYVGGRCRNILMCKISGESRNSSPTKRSKGILEENPFYIKDSFQIEFRHLTKLREIGQGNFGVVHLVLHDTGIKGHKKLAVKQLKPAAAEEYQTSFRKEMEIFKTIGYHENVVQMLGFCDYPDPLCIIMEYVGEHNLYNYLRNLREEFKRRTRRPALQQNGSVRYVELEMSVLQSSDYDNYIKPSEIESAPEQTSEETSCLIQRNQQPEKPALIYVLDSRELEDFGLQIARGMEHLEKKNIVHRDLAARNVLIDSRKRLKITDFGMSRTEDYVVTTRGQVPLRWMPLEAIVHKTYSNKSDVWSYGIVLWEIGTLGAHPYSSIQNEDIVSFLEKGGRLDQPGNVSDELYRIMEKCWASSPEDRPSFKELVLKFQSLREAKGHAYIDFSSLNSNYSFPPTEDEVSRSENVNEPVTETTEVTETDELQV